MSYNYVPYNDTPIKILSPPAAEGSPARQVDDNFCLIVDMAVAVAGDLATHVALTTSAMAASWPVRTAG